MGQVTSRDIKEAYASLLAKTDIAKANEVLTSGDTEPIFKTKTFYAEEEYSHHVLNKMFSEIALDITALHADIDAINDKYQGLLSNVTERLHSIHELLDEEEDRIVDANCLCNNFNDFVSIISITEDDVTGNIGVINKNTFSCYIDSKEQAKFVVQSAEGNGYEDEKTDKDNLTEDSQYMPYRYYRDSVNKQDNMPYPKHINFDKEDAICTLTISSETPFNTVKIDASHVILESAQYSEDGIIYQEYITSPIHLTKDIQKKFLSSEFIYGTNVIHMPTTNFAKLRFRSDKTQTIQTSLEDAKMPIELSRNIIEINSILGYRTQYSRGYFETKELIKSPVSSIAVFASEYFSRGIQNQTGLVTYILTVNGIDHEITPINQKRGGVKVIRMATYHNSDESHLIINESIKTAKLKVVMESPYVSVSPLISNIKICLGKGVS